jgi:hypothetical protein
MIEIETRNKRIEERDGGRTFACELVAVRVTSGAREDVGRRTFACALDNFRTTTEQIQRLLDKQKAKLLREAGNVQVIDLTTIQ